MPGDTAPGDRAPADTAPDAGLLAPVRAGTRAEAATSDRAWLQALLDAEVALVRAQVALGHAPDTAADAAAAVAHADRFDVTALARDSRGAGNPVVPLVTALTSAVRADDPAAAAWVHRGATSQDVMDTAAMLVAARTLAGVDTDLRRVCDALARLAAEHRATPITGRTLLQQAVPTTFGLKAAGWLLLVREAADALDGVRAALPVQLGGAAGTLAAFGVVDGGDERPDLQLVGAYAAALGLAEPSVPWHTLRTPVTALGAALTQVAVACGKVATDVVLLAQTEVGEVAEPAAAGRGGSSAMPHKRNPVLATMVRAAALQVPAQAQILAQAQVVAEHERPAGAWHAEWAPLRECLRLVGGGAATLAELAEGLEVRPERMRENLDLTGGAVVAERLSAVLGDAVGRPRAKELLTEASRRAAAEHRPLRAVLAEYDEVTAHLDGAALDELLDPARYLGAAPELVDRVLHPHDRRLG